MINQKAFVGTNSIAEMQCFIHSLSLKKVFLLRGKKSYVSCGAKDIMENVFSKEKLTVIEWCDFQENPKIEDLEKGLALFCESAADIIIAVGGGSVLDMAKLLRFSYSYEGNLTGKDFVKRKKLVPLVAVPTTSGTGCETTPFSVCYKDQVKYSVAHPDMQPDLAIIYPPFTYNNSPYLTACTGFDALAQAIEAYWNVNATPESDKYALEAICLLWHSLPEAVNAPTQEVRNKMSQGAYLAGRAISVTKTTAPHAFSYAFTTYCDYPHGHAVALTFPFFFELNVRKFDGLLQKTISEGAYKAKMMCLTRLLKIDGVSYAILFDYIKNIGLLSKGYKEDIKEMINKVNLERLSNNPVKISDEILLNLEKYLYEH